MTEIRFFGKTDTGLKRPNNEDAFLVRPDKGLCALADGMGGAAAGEIASQVFVETALEVFSENDEPPERKTRELIEDTFRLANRRILDNVNTNPHHQGMGCTAELVAFDHRWFFLGHVGDSRTYLLRNGYLRRLTRDHSLIQQQVDEGLLTPLEARRHPLRNVILRAVGVGEKLSVDIIQGEGRTGDVFLLCSDGLTDMVEDRVIEEVLLSTLELPQKAERLTTLAKSAGGYDNITVILCEIISNL